MNIMDRFWRIDAMLGAGYSRVGQEADEAIVFFVPLAIGLVAAVLTVASVIDDPHAVHFPDELGK